MAEIRTLKQRRADQLARMRTAIAQLERELRDFARSRGGRFVIFGSVARGEFEPDSDVDIVADFAPLDQLDAELAAERLCHSLGLQPDVRAPGDCSAELTDRIRRDGKVLA
jgi:predicted nucleotidyltransferase